MSLSVIIPESVIETDVMEFLSHKFRLRSSSNKEHILGTIFQFSIHGEMKFEADAYAACDAYGCVMDNGFFYHIFKDSEMDNLVPVAWPDSKDDDGIRIAYEDYFSRSNVQLEAGTWLVRIVRNGMSLSDVDRLIFQADLCPSEGEQFLVLSERMALMPKVEDEI